MKSGDDAQGKLELERVDLSDAAATGDTMGRVLATTDVHILVNNAGAQERHVAVDFPLDAFQRVMDVNVRAVFQLCQGFGRPMLGRGEGKIINIASLLSFQGGLAVPAYAASKSAVLGLTRALANEWAAAGVNVNAVAPGYMTTDMTETLRDDPERGTAISARIPAGRWGTPTDLGGAITFLASKASDYVHGTVIPVDGGWLAR